MTHHSHRTTRRLALSATGMVTTVLLLASTTDAAVVHRAAAHQKAAVATAKANPPVTFAQANSDLKPDPRARFGRLANGMTYVIYKNATPPNTATFYLRIGAGSIMEQDYQRGLAHFIEHMAFNGSKSIPEGDMVKLLERDGLSFGGDTNAFTSQDQTVFQLNLPTVEPKVIDDALFLFRETASNLSFDPGAIDRERGVVLGEERARATPGSKAADAELAATLPGQKYTVRDPIGLTDILKTAQRPAFTDFYRDFYRPEYATVIAVGDIDPDTIEAKIKALFADWKAPPQSANALTHYGTYRNKGEVVRTYVAKGLTESISISWLAPWHVRPDDRQHKFEELLDAAIHRTIAQRLARAAQSPDASFRAASFDRERIRNTATIHSVTVYPKPGKERAAMRDALMGMRQLLAGGVTQPELDRTLVYFRTAYAASAETARTRDNRTIASQIASSISAGSVLTSPAQDLAFFNDVAPRLTLAAVNARIRAMKLGDGPVIWAAGSDLHGIDEAALAATYRDTMALPVPPAPTHQAAVWPYTHFGVPAAVVDRVAIPDTGATRITFANGIILNVKSTKFDDKTVSVVIRFDAGYRNIAPSQAVALQAFARLGLTNGGLGKVEAKDIGDALNGRHVSVSFNIGEEASFMGGSTVQEDFETQIQWMMAMTTDSALRSDALDRMKEKLHDYYAHRDATPTGAMNARLGGILHDGDPRYSMPSEQAMMAVRREEIADIVKTVLSTAPIEITVVGDISVDEATAKVAATFGTLPRRTAVAPVAGADVMHFPTADLNHVILHQGRPDQNISELIWPTTDFYSDTHRAVGLQLLAAVMTLRELDEIREKQGASYGVNASSLTSPIYKGFGYIVTSAEVRPEMDATFYETVKKIVDDLRSKPVTEDELLRARGPILDRLKNNQQTNSYWTNVLDGSAQDPRGFKASLEYERDLKSITPAYIQQLALDYLDMSKALRFQVKPDPVKQ